MIAFSGPLIFLFALLMLNKQLSAKYEFFPNVFVILFKQQMFTSQMFGFQFCDDVKVQSIHSCKALRQM